MNISIKYCSAWGYEPEALSLTGKLINQFKQKIKSMTLIPDRGGCFEIMFDGDLVYSKLATDEFPKEADILNLVSKRLNAAKS